MTDAQTNLSAYRKALGAYSNPKPRDFATADAMSLQIDRAQAALEAIRPQRVEVEVTTETDPQKTLDLTSKTEENDDAPETQTRKRKTRHPNRQHEGGENREA